MPSKLVFMTLCGALLAFSLVARAQQQPPAPASHEASASDTAKANNPLMAAIGVNFQDYYAASLYGAPDSTSNSLLLRGMFPFKAGVVNLVRVTLPLVTAPAAMDADPTSGVGDLNLFDILVLTGPDDFVQFGKIGRASCRE